MATTHPNVPEDAEAAARRARHELMLRSAQEVDSWPSWKMRAAYAHPELVRRAEERERQQKASSQQEPPAR